LWGLRRLPAAGDVAGKELEQNVPTNCDVIARVSGLQRRIASVAIVSRTAPRCHRPDDPCGTVACLRPALRTSSCTAGSERVVDSTPTIATVISAQGHFVEPPRVPLVHWPGHVETGRHAAAPLNAGGLATTQQSTQHAPQSVVWSEEVPMERINFALLVTLRERARHAGNGPGAGPLSRSA
jgi:hypothetical protein